MIPQTTPIPYTVFPVTKAATDLSALEKLPEDVLIRICQFVGRPNLRRVCKELNALHLKAAPLFVNMFKRAVSFPGILPILDGYRLDLPNKNKYEIAVRSYFRLLQEIRNYKPDYTLPENLSANPFSLETIERLSQDYSMEQDQSLIAFCEALPENIREQLLDQSVIDLPLQDKAAALRERICASKRAPLNRLDLRDKNLTNIPAEIKYFPCRQLFLSKNPIRSIPDEITQSQTLQSLRLDDTLVHTIPVQPGQLENLRELVVTRSKIASFPIELGQLTHLEHLDIGDTPLAASLDMGLSQALEDLFTNSPSCSFAY